MVKPRLSNPDQVCKTKQLEVWAKRGSSLDAKGQCVPIQCVQAAWFLPDVVARVTQATFWLIGGLKQSCSTWSPKFMRRNHGHRPSSSKWHISGPQREISKLILSDLSTLWKSATVYSALPRIWQTFARCCWHYHQFLPETPSYRRGIETQSSEVTCPRWHSYEVFEQGLFHSWVLLHFGKPLGENSIRDEKTVEKAAGMVVAMVLAISVKSSLFIMRVVTFLTIHFPKGPKNWLTGAHHSTLFCFCFC